MNRLESKIIDIFDDVNLKETLTKFASKLSPDISSIDIPTREERDSYDDTVFALSIITKTASRLNKFPVNSKINTTLSNEYFELSHPALPVEAQKTAATHIKQACLRFGISPTESVDSAAANYPTMTNLFIENIGDTAGGSVLEKKANDSSSKHYYALTKEAGDGSTNRKYAMPNVEFLQKAIAYFDKYASQFSPEDRHQFAGNVAKRASELGVAIKSPTIQKYAGSTYGNNMEEALMLRKGILEGDPKFVGALNKLASYKDTESPETFAKVLHELDKKAGLDNHYGKHIPDPYLSTFGNKITKTASYIYNEDGITMTEDDLTKIASDKFATLKNYFGPTLAEGLKKEGMSAFVALPANAKDIIARIANGEIQ